MLYNVVLVSAVHQHKSAIIIHICHLLLEPPSPLVITEHHAGSLCYTAPSHQLSVLHVSVHVLVLLSPFIPLFAYATVSTALFSVSVSPFLPCK